ncbi:uncharacterized protein [Typha angustifolia]|uniref:uncharacterized protein n=1 Tax=Typha angustifolia TaxID=59011 RepID=UPI003C2D4E67
MIDDQDLGLVAGFLGIFIFTLVIAYHHVLANQNFEGNRHLTIKKLQRSTGYEIVSASTLQTKEQANISNIPYVVTGVAHMRLACNHVTRCWELAGSI